MDSKKCPAAIALLLAFAFLGSTPVHAARQDRTPPDSYLQYRVWTVSQLIQQVQENPTVRQRYARHFQIPEDRVVSYMKANLVESYIPETRRYTVYCVARSGKFFPVRQTFRKGTKVFALRNGQPVLKWLCGNPLSRFLPAVQLQTIRTRTSPSLEERVVTPAENVDVLVPNEEETPVFLPSVPVSIGSSSVSLVSVLEGGAALIPAAFLFSNGGGGGGGGSIQHHTPPAVPEPASPVYLLVVLPAVMLIAARRRRTRGTTGTSGTS